jgi:hypothetical protein
MRKRTRYNFENVEAFGALTANDKIEMLKALQAQNKSLIQTVHQKNAYILKLHQEKSSDNYKIGAAAEVLARELKRNAANNRAQPSTESSDQDFREYTHEVRSY